MAVTVLRGCSWDHPRGHAPMLATAASYEERSGGATRIEWTPRSLREFGMTPVEQLARDFDLIVMDHPHIGMVAESGCAVALEGVLDEAVLAAIGRGSPGGSQQSYEYGGSQWGLAVDAACQSSAWRPDLIAEPPATWDEVVELSRGGRVLWPLCDVDAAASLLTIAASCGRPAGSVRDGLVERDVALRAVELMRLVASNSDARCLTANPIHTLEAMTATDRFVYSPLTFCYVSYSRADRQGPRVAYGPVPRAGDHPAQGALLGGAGLVVSAYGRSPELAADYAAFVAGERVQRGGYFASGGQPAHAAAWGDAALDQRAGGFFSALGPVIGTAWTRPRWPAFAAFQNEMIELFGRWWDRAEDAGGLLDELDARYRDSLAGQAGACGG
jgi:multiple sugar transport system substrate-binding protein